MGIVQVYDEELGGYDSKFQRLETKSLLINVHCLTKEQFENSYTSCKAYYKGNPIIDETQKISEVINNLIIDLSVGVIWGGGVVLLGVTFYPYAFNKLSLFFWGVLNGIIYSQRSFNDDSSNDYSDYILGEYTKQCVEERAHMVCNHHMVSKKDSFNAETNSFHEVKIGDVDGEMSFFWNDSFEESYEGS
jgi:hypothetical protein